MEIHSPLHPWRLKRLKRYIKHLDGLVGYWPLWEQSGTVVKNYSPGGLGNEVVVNGGFDTDSDWTKQTGWTISGGQAVRTASGAGFLLSASVPPLVAGKRYKSTIKIDEVGGAGFAIIYGSNQGAARTTTGTFVEEIVSDGTALVINTGSSSTGKIDSISVKEVNRLDGTSTGVTLGQRGQAGKAYSFDGSNDKVIVADDNLLDLTGTFSVGCLINPTIASLDAIVSKGLFDVNRNYTLVLLANGTIEFGVGDTSTAFNVGSNTALTGGAWNYILATYDDSINTVKLYIDGALDKTDATVSVSATANNTDLGIGAEGNGASPLQGLLQHITIFDKVLTAGQALKLAQIAGVA